MKEIFLCAINNILSGNCKEDCKFCSQSIKYKANIERYNYKKIDIIVNEAKLAKKYGATGYCLVTAGKGLDNKKSEFVASVAHAIKSKVDGLNLIACNGIATKEQLKYLKDNGIDSYNHNLETSQRYYKEICSTHSWEERYKTCLNVKEVGLKLCSGGIFGMGENIDDRIELIKSIISLNPQSIPLNFYHPNPSLPIKNNNITLNDALEIIKISRDLIGDNKLLMIAGGRELIFSNNYKDMFDAGANAIVIGNYLTTKGNRPNKDRDILDKLGYRVVSDCK
jgi:biotin synthase